MTDIAALILGVITLWNTCIEVFDTIDSGRHYGMDYEILQVKLEVERIRLLTWGMQLALARWSTVDQVQILNSIAMTYVGLYCTSWGVYTTFSNTQKGSRITTVCTGSHL